MTKLLDSIFAEARNIDCDAFEPMDEVTFGDHVVAVMDDQHKKLYALAESYKKRAEKAFHDVSCRVFDRASRATKNCFKDVLAIQGRARAITEIFESSIRDAHDLWGEGIAIREGWQVVRIAIEEIPNRKRSDFTNTFDPRH